MQTVELNLSPGVELHRAGAGIEAALVELGLVITLRGTLKAFPGCQHWHAKRPHCPGTLEITVWPQRHRAWLTIQQGRVAAWITAELSEVRRRLEGQLLSLAS